MGSATFNLTGGWQKWPVPSKVNRVKVTLHGGGCPSGSKGGLVSGFLSVKDDDVLWLLVGGRGFNNSGETGGSGGFGAGGHGGSGYNHAGGEGGGGYSAIRLNGTAGTILAVAGGAGGESGDGGAGGDGGPQTGESGSRGTAGTGATGDATGGTQTQGGNGGTSSSGSRFYGSDASNSALGLAGRGGGTGGFDGPGGGGGGGGWRSGGGGTGGSQGWAPGGGGAGGANYSARLDSAISQRGGGTTGNGVITLEWSDPAPGNSRPNTPHLVSPTSGQRLGKNQVTIKATVTDPNATQKVRLVVYLSVNDFKTQSGPYYSDYVASGKTTTITRNLDPNRHYKARLYAQDADDALSLGYAVATFYSNYDPLAPTLLTPANGATITGLSSTVFDWTVHDPDSQPQSKAELQFWRDGHFDGVVTHTILGSSSTYTQDPLTFKGNSFYLWRVRTRDPVLQWGPWSSPFRFFVSGASTPPRLLSPLKEEAVDVGEDTTFTWKFFDPDQGDTQSKADLRYRVKGTEEWITRFGTTSTPGGDHSWTLSARTFGAGFVYEWQVRTYDTLSGGLIPSDWSDPGFFRTVFSVGFAAADLPVPSNDFLGSLGCGDNKAYLAVKGGHILLGQLTPTSLIRWGRTRDDISTATVVLPINCDNGDVCQLAAVARSWQHEVVVYRQTDQGTQRVWEGPITRIAYYTDRVEIEARDVLGWAYRRIMRQGYNDTYPNTQSVVFRAARILINAYAIDDPNVLKFLTLFQFDDDAKESRVRADWQSTAWEEVDDLAANAGLDYTVVGRRIVLYDTHRPIGRLPVMRNGDFSADPVVTEYGLSYATLYGVTNNAGVYGYATRDDSYTGPVELLASAYGEQAGAADVTLTPAHRQELIDTLSKQARRGIVDRFPIPLQVHLPDNSTIQPQVPVSIQHLVPGVWIPLQAEHVCRTFSQWQKLDSVTVEQDAAGEKVQVVMSPAPDNGEDPDAAAAAEADSGN